MIAPTAAFRDVPALSAETAAELVLRPLSTKERHVGTLPASLFELAHRIAPQWMERLLSYAHRGLPSEQAAAIGGSA
jgi:hypothetical protein